MRWMCARRGSRRRRAKRRPRGLAAGISTPHAVIRARPLRGATSVPVWLPQRATPVLWRPPRRAARDTGREPRSDQRRAARDAGVPDSKPTCGACRHGSPEVERSDFLAASSLLAISEPRVTRVLLAPSPATESAVLAAGAAGYERSETSGTRSQEAAGRHGCVAVVTTRPQRLAPKKLNPKHLSGLPVEKRKSEVIGAPS
jgi:hypothetical protein